MINSLIENKLLESRIIFLTGRIDDELANGIIAQLLYLENKDPEKDISIYINSPGGSVAAGMAMYDTMNFVKCDVSTFCIGLAASMAAFLLSCGTPGKRFSLPNSEIMIHQPHSAFDGQVSDILIQAKQVGRVKNKMIRIISANTHQPLDKVERDMDRDYFMSAQEAYEYGLIDKILEGKYGL